MRKKSEFKHKAKPRPKTVSVELTTTYANLLEIKVYHLRENKALTKKLECGRGTASYML